MTNTPVLMEGGSLRWMKATAKALMSEAAYERTAASWRFFRRWETRFVWMAQTRFSLGLPDTLLHFGIGPGDDLLCTTLLRELKKRGRKKIWMMSKHPGLFEKNRDVERVVPIDDRFREYVSAFGKNWQQLEYARMNFATDQSEPPERHIIAELCYRAGVSGEIALRPYFYLRDEERRKASWAGGMIAIQSSGLGGQLPMRNKQWFPERFQAVVNALVGEFKFVQLGSASDPMLNGAIDLRGQTNLRETAAVLANCRVFVGNVGFLMHLARAVECPSVIVFGGREAPWQSGYSGNINLYSPVSCAPCWLWNKCDHDRVCMDVITPEEVIESVKLQLETPSGNLPVDQTVI